MIRQAHTYLAGAVSGSALVGAAVVAFVLLVSLQALKDWPLAGIGGAGGESAVSSGQPVQGGTAAGGAAAPGAVAGTAAPGGAAGQSGKGPDGGQSAAAQQGGQPTATTSPLPGSPASQAPSPAAGDGASTPSAASNPSAGGGSDGGGSGSPPVKAGGGAPGGGGQSTSGTVTGAVNDTVSGVDQSLGGALSETGAAKVTEEVVNGVAGPESPIGETLDKTVEAVGGLVGGGRR